MILAIDPGTTQSGIAYIDKGSYEPIMVKKIDNEAVLKESHRAWGGGVTDVVIEMVAHYGTGMPAGKTVFGTCVWIGRFYQHFASLGLPVHLMERREVKMNLCGTMRAKDSNVRQALVDRFASGERNYGKGTKASPGWFYGFKTDIWQAYALGVTYIDEREEF